MATHDPESPPSPNPQPMTKRDVRRNRIMEKLQGMIDSFSSNQHHHYRAQLQAVQADMTLILKADPYAPSFGEIEGEELRQEIEGLVPQVAGEEGARKDFWRLAGRRYEEFVRRVNDLGEERDGELTALRNHHTSSINELDRLTQQKLHQAEEEHKELTHTIRARLIASITKKRNQLMRDKEQLDIADSNALLLNPSHFSINNPGSPPNGLQNRKTRHLRHRAGSPNPGDLEGNGKKKRKAAAMEDEGNESPAPAFRPLGSTDMLGSRSPFKDARDKNVYAQYEAPAYSLERIFTEKELAMATETARRATYMYFQGQSQNQPQPPNGVPTVDENAVDVTEDTTDALASTEKDPAATPPPSAPEMDRTASSHAILTRGGARANPLAALQDLATLAAAEHRPAPLGGLNKDPFAPVVPTHHAVSKSEKSGAPAPPSVSNFDLENDFRMMRAFSTVNPADAAAGGGEKEEEGESEVAREQMRRQLLDQALGHQGVAQPYRLPLLETGPALIGKGVDRLPSTGFAPVMAVAEKARQGREPAGGSLAAALRQGGEAMSRTTSAAGSEGGEGTVGVGTRRGRGRQLV